MLAIVKTELGKFPYQAAGFLQVMIRFFASILKQVFLLLLYFSQVCNIPFERVQMDFPFGNHSPVGFSTSQYLILPQ